MKNYIVRNCPCYIEQEPYGNTCCQLYTCESDSDCLLKRIVELCDTNANKVLYEGETLKFIEGNPLAKKILELLEIEEVDE